MEIIGVIVAGIIIGLLGKFVAPGNRDNIPIWLTIPAVSLRLSPMGRADCSAAISTWTRGWCASSGQ